MDTEQRGGDLVGKDEEDVGLPGGATFGGWGRVGGCLEGW